LNTTYLINRICSGLFRVKISLPKPSDRDILLIKRNPTTEIKYIAEEIYEESLMDAMRLDLISQGEMLAKLMKLGHWTDEKQTKISQLEKDIETLKVGLFEKSAKLTNHDDYVIRSKIRGAYKDIENLLCEKHSYDYITAEGYAGICKTRYLIRNSLFTLKGEAEFSPYDTRYLYRIDDLVDKSLEYINDNKIMEEEYRKVARSNEWQQLWESSNCAQNLYGTPSCEIGTEQILLFNWSKLYDGINQNPDRPRKNIMEDDYKLDGWLILEREKLEKGVIENEYDKRLGKTGDKEEIYVPIDKVEEIKEVENLNDIQSKMIKKQRMDALSKSKGGQLHEFEMPDTKRKIQMLQNQAAK